MLKVLMIDDSKAVHAFLSTCFTEAEVSLSHAFNGKEGVEAWKANPKFDLVLLDWEMPILDGPGALSQLKAAGIECPIVMMTTRNAAEDIVRMLEAGASEYILKPFTKDILREKIEQVLGKAIQRAA